MSARLSRVATVAITVVTIGALIGFLCTQNAFRPAASLATLPAQLYAGYNVESGYAYSLESDCYAQGAAACPDGSWCNVIARENWYPWDVSYISRGRCLPYAQEGHACEPSASLSDTAFPRTESGKYYERATLCAPQLICTGANAHDALNMCTKRRLASSGCESTKANGCAGRPNGGADCPDSRYCKSGPVPFSQLQLEQCASIFNGFNGPTFAFGANSFSADPSARAVSEESEPAPNASDWRGLPSDQNIEGGEVRPMYKRVLEHGTNVKLANRLLRTLWPFPVCDEGEQGGCPPNHVLASGEQPSTEHPNSRRPGLQCVPCTAFPLPFVQRDNDGGLEPRGGLCYEPAGVGTCANASFLLNTVTGKPIDGLGVIDYHCSWAIMHMLSMNGAPMLSVAEADAMRDLLLYTQGQFGCKVCRSNLNLIIEHYGLPQGFARADYAHYFWVAHNNANEHSYATHSPSEQQLAVLRESQPDKAALLTTRMDQWANPVYMHPWFMDFDDAYHNWHNERLDGLRLRARANVNG